MSAPTFAGNPSVEVAVTTLAAATPAGVGLQYNGSGVLAPATTRLDAIMMSEVVTLAEANNRQYLYGNIDFGAWTRVGEPVSVAKGFKGMTATGLSMKDSASVIPAGSALIMDNTTGNFKLNGTPGTGDLAIVLQDIPAHAASSGLVHLL